MKLEISILFLNILVVYLIEFFVSVDILSLSMELFEVFLLFPDGNERLAVPKVVLVHLIDMR